MYILRTPELTCALRVNGSLLSSMNLSCVDVPLAGSDTCVV